MENNLNELLHYYYYLDYLRLHNYAIRNKIFNNNKKMLERALYQDTKFGYKAIIQRTFKEILSHLYKDFEIIKPRGRFAYELGRKNDSSRNILKLDISEDKIKYILKQYLLYGEHAEIVAEYRQKIQLYLASGIELKNRDSGLIVNLHNIKCNGWLLLKALKDIRTTQDKLIEAGGNIEEIVKNNLIRGVAGAIKKHSQNDTENMAKASYYKYSFVQRSEPTITQPVAPAINSLSSLEELVINEVRSLFENTNTRLTPGMKFNLAKSSVIRRLRMEGDNRLESIQILPITSRLSAIIERIGGTNEN